MKNLVLESRFKCRNIIPDRKDVPARAEQASYRIVLGAPERKEKDLAWHELAIQYHSRDLRGWILMNDRLNYARDLYSECVASDPLVRGGVPVIRGSRVPVALVLANLVDDLTISEIGEDLGLDVDALKAFIKCIAIAFDRPAHEHNSTRRVHDVKAIDPLLLAGGKDINTGVPATPAGEERQRSGNASVVEDAWRSSFDE